MSIVIRPATPPDQSVLLTVVADTALTQIALFDGSFQLRERDIGRMEVSLSPGIYGLQYRAAGAAASEIVVIRDQAAQVVVKGPQLHIQSAVPIAGSSTEAASEIDLVETLNEEVLRRMQRTGATAVSLIFRTKNPADAAHLPKGAFSLHSLDGSRLIGRQHQAETLVSETWDAPHGDYILRTQFGPDKSALHRAVYVPPGRIARLFFVLDHEGDGKQWKVINSSVVYSDLPVSEIGLTLKLAETAKWLAHGQFSKENPRIATRAIRSLSSGVFNAEPMLALLVCSWANEVGALPQAQTAFDFATEGLFTHPDLVALALLAAIERGSSAAPSFVQANRYEDFLLAALKLNPPMLLSTWRALIRRSANTPWVIAAGSPAAVIGPTSGGEGPWLTWETEEIASNILEQVNLSNANLELQLDAVAIAAFQRVLKADLPQNESDVERTWKEITTSVRLTTRESWLMGFAIRSYWRSIRLSSRQDSGEESLAEQFVREGNIPLGSAGTIFYSLKRTLEGISGQKRRPRRKS
jgi:hypothetical protein